MVMGRIPWISHAEVADASPESPISTLATRSGNTRPVEVDRQEPQGPALGTCPKSGLRNWIAQRAGRLCERPYFNANARDRGPAPSAVLYLLLTDAKSQALSRSRGKRNRCHERPRGEPIPLPHRAPELRVALARNIAVSCRDSRAWACPRCTIASGGSPP